MNAQPHPSLDALLLGDPALLPFAGHLRLRLQGRRARLSIAGRIAAGAPLDEAFRVSRRLSNVLLTVPDGAWAETDRHGLIRRAWQILAELPAERLGPSGGADLSLLLVAEDIRGIGIAGVGLSGAWALVGEQYRILVPPGHPLLGPPGRPRTLPGVLTLERGLLRFVASPFHLEPVLPPFADVPQRCGAPEIPATAGEQMEVEA